MLLCYLPVRMLLGQDRPEIVLQTGSSSPPSKLAFSPDRRLLVSIGTYAGSIEFWDWQTGRELRSIDLNVRGAEATSATFVFTPDGRQIVLATPNRIWRIDVATGRQLQSAELRNDPRSVHLTQLVLSADGTRLASMALASMNNRLDSKRSRYAVRARHQRDRPQSGRETTGDERWVTHLCKPFVI
jgi:WD40 repeat protein